MNQIDLTSVHHNLEASFANIIICFESYKEIMSCRLHHVRDIGTTIMCVSNQWSGHSIAIMNLEPIPPEYDADRNMVKSFYSSKGKFYLHKQV